MAFSKLDYIIFCAYGLIIIGVGLFISRNKAGEKNDTKQYFLANSSLPWWAVGASLIAANISAEHFIAMSGSGFRIGLGIAAYEWIAALTLIFVAIFFLPIFLKNKIYTMPQFLKLRFNQSVSSAFAIFWLMVYIFVNLTSVMWLGAMAINSILGIPVIYGIIILAFISGLYSIYGGLKAVAWTDVIQVIFLVGGGIITTYISLDAVSQNQGALSGLKTIFYEAKDHFQMIIPRGTMIQNGTKDAFIDLPGLAVIFGAMWITNIGYWGFNQYIIQKGLAAKNIKEARNGLLFAAFLKVLIPILVIIPGITAYVLHSNPELLSNYEISGIISKADEAYPWLLKNFVPEGVRGLAFAALIAAIISSLASMINSTSTIFTLDVYKVFIKPKASEKELVNIGRWVALFSLLIATIAAKPLLGGLDQAFQYIQEYTGYIYPGVVVVFSAGLFWKQATSKASMWTAALTIPIGIIIKLIFPEMPFIIRMGYVFILLCFIIFIISMTDKKHNVIKNIKLKGKRNNIIEIFLLSLGILLLLTGFILHNTFYHLGFESIYMLGIVFIAIGIVGYLNTNYPWQSKLALENKKDDFKIDLIFKIGSLTLVAIVGLLYFLFW